MDQHAKGLAFRALHESGIFVMPCAWDAGSARQFARSGFAAIGTTSGGVNWSAGRADYVYSVDRDEMLDAYGAIARAVDLPVSGDHENGYGTSPDDVAATITAAIARGMVGGSIEDQTMDTEPGLIPVDLATERIAAARQAADATSIPFTLTARAESYYGGVDDPFADAVERSNRYVEAGADCVFVPGVSTFDVIASLVAEVDAPISVGVGSGGTDLSIAALADVGVRRVSTGGLIPRALAALVDRASRELLTHGTFGFAADAVSGSDLNELHGNG